jgi:hypothetical protein
MIYRSLRPPAGLICHFQPHNGVAKFRMNIAEPSARLQNAHVTQSTYFEQFSACFLVRGFRRRTIWRYSSVAATTNSKEAVGNKSPDNSELFSFFDLRCMATNNLKTSLRREIQLARLIFTRLILNKLNIFRCDKMETLLEASIGFPMALFAGQAGYSTPIPTHDARKIACGRITGSLFGRIILSPLRD